MVFSRVPNPTREWCLLRLMFTQCIRAVIAQFGHPLEADDSPQQPNAVASFLMESLDDFNVIFIVNVGHGFPQTGPQLLVSSAAHTAEREGPIRLLYGPVDYPYSPRWGATEFARRIRSFAIETALPELLQDRVERVHA
eukprot:SAG22_NODE_13166_length_416_cov_1.214511_1_plen_138_part_11